MPETLIVGQILKTVTETANKSEPVLEPDQNPQII